MTVRSGRALAGLKPMAVKTANAVFRGEVLFDDGTIHRGFLKDLDARQFANELLVATLGRRLGVQVAEAAIVFVSPEVSDSFSQIAHSDGTGFVAFFSRDAGPATVAQIVKAGVGGAMECLKRGPALGNMYGLDTWVANVDRHANNIVLSGDGDAYLMDHGHCFSGPSWSATDLNSAAAYTNRLSDWLTPHLDDQEKAQALSDIKKLIGGMVGTDVEDLVQEAMVRELYGEPDSEAVIGFLEARVSSIESLAAAALGKLL